MIELAPIVTVTNGSGLLKKQSSSITLITDEPCHWQIVLDNSEGDYGPASPIANPRTYSNYLKINVDDGNDTWVSPDLVMEDYDYDTDQITLSGRCRLSELDREDQTMTDAENTTVAAVLAEIAAEYGLTVTGAPNRTVVLFHRIGNPLQWFRDLLYPTHTFRMGAGNEIVVEPINGQTPSVSYVDRDHLEVLRFKRTSDIFNRATVERVAPTSGRITLVNTERSGGSELGSNRTVALSEPSRFFNFNKAIGRRGLIQSIVLRDANGDPINAQQPYTMPSYVGNEAVHQITFSYDLVDPDAVNWGEWTPRWEILITGYPLTADPVPTEGYSSTVTSGLGDRPYPEVFTSLAIETQTDAQAAAQALVDRGTREGNILNFQVRLLASLIPNANEAVNVTDHHSGFSGAWVVESVTISENESGETGQITVEATRSEAA